MIQPLPETRPLDRLTPTRTRLTIGLRRWWWVGLILLLIFLLSHLASGQAHSGQPGSARNPTPSGFMAVAQILGRQGVTIEQVTRLDGLKALASEDTTIFVPDASVVTADELSEIRQLPGDVVIAGNPYLNLAPLTSSVSMSPSGSATPVTSECTDPDAEAAARISAPTGGITVEDPDVTGCFPMGETFGYATWTDGSRTFRLVADSAVFTNRALANDGNAALALRALGHHPTVLWYLPREYGTGLESHAGFFHTVPPLAGPLVFVAAGIAALAAVTYGRRMGPVVQETLPVIVKPGEAVYGRGRLYHRAGATGHAAQGMRAGTARRLARRLGLSRSAQAHELVRQVSAASGWPDTRVREVLYGPPPTSSAELVELATTLKNLEESSR